MSSELTPEEIQAGPPLSWIIRGCDNIKSELRECSRVKGRFHQYFIHGYTLDCSQWETDYQNCLLFRQSRDPKYRDLLLASEQQRRNQRLAGHYGVTVWGHRSSPPPDWDRPLSDTLRERQEDSMITKLAREEKKAAEGTASFK